MEDLYKEAEVVRCRMKVAVPFCFFVQIISTNIRLNVVYWYSTKITCSRNKEKTKKEIISCVKKGGQV